MLGAGHLMPFGVASHVAKVNGLESARNAPRAQNPSRGPNEF